MSNGQTWTANADITPDEINIPVFHSFFETKTIGNFTYNQTLSINNKFYYLQHISPNQGNYLKESDNSNGTFKYCRGILIFKNDSDVEIEKFTNNHGTEIDDYIIQNIN